MLKGLGEIRTSIAQRAAGPEGGIPELNIASGEIALIHFLTDRGDIVECRFHSVKDVGRSGRPFTRERLCRQELKEACPHCQSPDQDVSKRFLRWYAWVYVYGVLTPSVPVGLEPGVKVEQIQRGVRTLNLWPLKGPAILRKGEGNNKYIINQLLTHEDRHGTLCDRIYEWERAGTGRNDTTYTLSAMSDIAARPQVNVQSLEEIIIKELPTSDFPRRQKEQQATAAAGGAGPQGGGLSALMGLLGDRTKEQL
jgi:hypothetical protein